MKTICYCSDVSEQQIVYAVKDGARNLSDIKKMTGACTVGRCKELHPKGT